MIALNYSVTSKVAQVTAHIPDVWKGVNPIDTPGGIQQMVTLSEHGLYFFLGRSDKPAALQFQMWVYGEVIPAIRKTGRYAAKPELDFEMPDLRSRKLISERTSAYMNWSWDVRQALKKAGVEVESPMPCAGESEMAQVVVGALLREYRWLLSFDHDLHMRLSPVPLDAAVVNSQGCIDWIDDSSFPAQALPAVITAATGRLARMIR